VPPERRHLVTVPAPGAPHDTLWRRFAGVLGIPDGLCELAAPTSNPSLGAAEVEVLRRVNQALGDRYPHRAPYQQVVQRHLVDAVLKRRGNEQRFGIGADRAEWVAGLAERQIEELAAYPCQVAGDLAELRPVTTRTASAPTPDELDDGQVLAVALETIVDLLGHAESLRRRPDEAIFSRLRSRAARDLKRGLRRTAPRDR
jgi:hypothetical protein